MKNIKDFVKFDNELFFKDKLLFLNNVSDLFAYENGIKTDKIIGKKLHIVIINDETIYKTDNITNEFNDFNIKFIDNQELILNLKSTFKLVGNFKSTVYGNYQNELSITIKNDNIQVIEND